MALLDEGARRVVEATSVGGTALETPQEAGKSRAQAAFRDQGTTDLSGQPNSNWPAGAVFAPGFPKADQRGLVSWPGLDGQLMQFLARRSVEANATVMRQARQAYEEINAIGRGESGYNA